jgi:hypothetical protein
MKGQEISQDDREEGSEEVESEEGGSEESKEDSRRESLFGLLLLWSATLTLLVPF